MGKAESVTELELVLAKIVQAAASDDCPTLLAQALEHAVFPGGARVRPKLCLAVARANQCDTPELALRAAAAVELLHCASLVHDDLPCFDDAAIRRGKPTVHKAFGEPIAILTGDALIIAAFEALGTLPLDNRTALRLPRVMHIIARGTGAPYGICAGQAWESEPSVDLSLYHQAKTGALFVAATTAGAAAAGVDTGDWAGLGTSIGEAYQVADDIQDAISTPEALGKPCAQDAHLDRPSAVAELGVQGAAQRLRELIERGLDSVPPCHGRDKLLDLVRAQAQGFVPKGLGKVAA
ncbi:MAG: polyprenyl synthetase family protein [Halieaceae bacterium]|jgi:geranylgeranyl diphosphate synthase type II|nr:polyprenyl synthetase family protein [Halieaceae bacterium]